MFKRNYKLICAALVLLLTMQFCACGGASASGSAPASAPSVAAEEPVTLDWYINFSWFTTTWGDNLVASAITEKTGVKINFITPAGNEWDQLNAMIASETLPDLVTLGHWEPQINQMVEEGQVYPLNELANQYAPGFWDEAHPQRVAWYTREDGNLYGYPNSSYTPADYEMYDNVASNQTFLVRKDIYEAIGSPDMTTPKGFTEALRAAAEQFPETEAGPLIPIGLYDMDKDGCFSLEGILMNLLAIPFEQDGNWYDRYTHPEYIAWLKVFRQLNEEGLLASDVFVDKRLQMAEKVVDGRYFCMIYQHTDIADQQGYLYARSPESVYIAVDGPKNAAGDDHTLPIAGINGWTVTLVSKNCEVPDKAIQLITFLISEAGQKLTYLGAEGETYDMADGKPVIHEDVLELKSNDRMAYNAAYGADNTYWMFQDLAMQAAWQPPAQEPLKQPLEWTYPYTVYTAQYDTIFTQGTEVASVNAKIREEWGRVLPRLLLAESDEAFDAIWEEYLQKREAIGHSMVREVASQQMREAKERLQIE